MLIVLVIVIRGVRLVMSPLSLLLVLLPLFTITMTVARCSCYGYRGFGDQALEGLYRVEGVRGLRHHQQCQKRNDRGQPCRWNVVSPRT